MLFLVVNGCNWRISGTNMLSTDSNFELIQDAIRNPDELSKVHGHMVPKLSQAYLAEHTGHRAPIFINKEQRTIDFSQF